MVPPKTWKLLAWGVAITLAAGLGMVGWAASTPPAGSPTMSFEDYEPKSTLHVPEHHPQRAKYPFIDVHNHQDRDQSAADVAKLVADMDFVPREEFDAVKAMAAKARSENEKLEARIAALEARLAAGKDDSPAT